MDIRERSRSVRRRLGTSALALMLAGLAACSMRSTTEGPRGPEGETPVEEARAAATGKAPDDVPPRDSDARTVDGYKRDAARRVYYRSTRQLYDGPPPPLLKSVVVLSIEVDRDGDVKDVRVVRSNGLRDLERAAIGSVRDASPLPRPHDRIVKRNRVGFYETWLFRDDGRFQIRSLADAQATE